MTDLKPPSSSPPLFNDLKARVASGVVMLAVAVGALAAGGVWFALFWLAAALAILWEWQRLLGAGWRERFLVGALGVVVAAALAAQMAADVALAPLAIAALAVAWRAPRGLKLWAAGGVLYAGALVVSVEALRPNIGGPLEPAVNLKAVLWLCAVVWGSDIGAYFAGRLIGGPKLWLRVSAGKTWSGAIGGALAGAGLGLAVALWWPAAPAAQSWTPLIVMGIAVSIASQCGDLFESAVKRRFGVKDSSRLIPGHGGVMDRLDGFVAAAAFVVLVAVVRGAPSAAEGVLVWN